MSRPMTTSPVLEYAFLFFLLCSNLASSSKISSRAELLKSLSGVRKGNNVNGVQELKKYLAHLGYSNYKDNSNNSNNIFDDSLESALKGYQQFYNLNVTGLLDPTTIARMHEARCGMPDLHNYGGIPPHMVSHYSFFPYDPKWRRRTLKYAFNRGTKEEAVRPLESAMREWASVTPFRFRRVGTLREADIRLSFLRGRHGDGLPFGGPDPEGGLAHSFPPPDGRVHFDAAQKWAHDGDGDAFDVRTVGLHELGHALGLGHSNVPQAVMYAIVAPGERKKLHEDDIKGIRALYKIK